MNTYVSKSLLLNFTESFKVVNKYCMAPDNDRPFSYLNEAKVACTNDEGCIGVDNYRCKDGNYRLLCLIGQELRDDASSCYYEKIGIFISSLYSFKFSLKSNQTL